MSVFTVAAFAALIQAQGCVPARLADVMIAIGWHESRLNSLAIHDNAANVSFTPGTEVEAIKLATVLIAQGHDLDLGVGQVNVRNLKWTGLTLQTAFDPCANIAAGAKVLLSKYQGNPPDSGKALYSASVLAAIPKAGAPISSAAPTSPSPFSKPVRTGREVAFATERK